MNPLENVRREQAGGLYEAWNGAWLAYTVQNCILS